MDLRRGSGRAGGLAQERALAPVAFDAMNESAGNVREQNGEDKTGKSRA
jgi:hypothetical protein